jgi:hypothetical protein
LETRRTELAAISENTLATMDPPERDERFHFEGERAFHEELRSKQGSSITSREQPFDDRVYAVLVHGGAGDVLLKLAWGGWNECPAPGPQKLMLDRWRERYDARIVHISHDVLEFQVGRPPTLAKELAALTWEQYLFCSDIVDQGTGTLMKLAMELRGNRRWFFWWD